MKRYKFFLNNGFGKNKTIIVSSYSSVRAQEMIYEEFPNWKISMFWVCWPF